MLEYGTIEEIAKAEVEDLKKLLSVNEEIVNQILSLAQKSLHKSPYED